MKIIDTNKTNSLRMKMDSNISFKAVFLQGRVSAIFSYVLLKSMKGKQ